MSRCPYADVPCHRVLNARGELAPFPAFGTGDGQRLLLEMEGIPVFPDGRVELSLYVWRAGALGAPASMNISERLDKMMNRHYKALELDKILDLLAGETGCADAAAMPGGWNRR